MSETKKSVPCLFGDENDLPPDTSLYRYLSTESFLYLLGFERLTISRITEWPDSYEGTRFELLKKVNKDTEFSSEFSNVSKGDFYASCWTLQTEERCLYSTEEQFNGAQKELASNGSAAMWESYCRNGGVRRKRKRKRKRGQIYFMEEIRSGKLYLVWYYILDYENNKNPFAERKRQIIAWKKYAVADVYENSTIIKKANLLNNKGFQKIDSLHIACAVYTNCDYFLTTDDKILKKAYAAKEIKVIDILGFIKEIPL